MRLILEIQRRPRKQMHSGGLGGFLSVSVSSVSSSPRVVWHGGPEAYSKRQPALLKRDGVKGTAAGLPSYTFHKG